jgi:outer membrane protein OmpU
MDGVKLSASYTPSDSGHIESSNDYGVEYTGVDGLTVGIATGENNAVENGTLDITNMYVKYAMDAFTVGYQASESDSEVADADLDFTAMGISYAVTEEMSISVNSSTVDYENSSLSDQDSMGVSVSYVMGSMTIKAAHNTVDNIAGATTADRSAYDLSLAFAF